MRQRRFRGVACGGQEAAGAGTCVHDKRSHLCLGSEASLGQDLRRGHLNLHSMWMLLNFTKLLRFKCCISSLLDMIYLFSHDCNVNLSPVWWLCCTLNQFLLQGMQATVRHRNFAYACVCERERVRETHTRTVKMHAL